MNTENPGRRVTRVDELPRDIPPARDLWPAIAAAIEAEQAGARMPAERRRSAWWPAAGMAAAVGLVAIGVLIGRGLPPTAVQPVAATQVPANVPAGDPGLMPAAYRQQRDALLGEVQAKLAAMPEAERAKVKASLDTLQRSINEIETALGRDPANVLLQELFVNSCQEEMRALTAVRDSGSQET